MIDDSDLTESDLSFPRRKPRSLAVSAAYRGFRLGKLLLGTKTVLRLCLDGAWLLQRFASEICAERVDEAAHDVRLGLSMGLLRDWVPPGASVLDVGCGIGRWCRSLSAHCSRIVGVDYDPRSIERARKLTEAANVEYVLIDVSRTLEQELTGRTFDVALAAHLLEHIEEPDGLLISLRAIATRLVIEVPDFDADRMNLARYRLGAPFYTDGDHVREYTLGVLRSQLERTGWTMTRHEQRRGSIIALAEATTPP